MTATKLPTNFTVNGWRYWTHTEMVKYEFAGNVAYYDGLTTCYRQQVGKPDTLEELSPDEYMRMVSYA